MKLYRNWIPCGLVIMAGAALTSSCSFHHKKYENPITKDTQQPDKVLFDKAVADIEHGRYEVARITLNTLINTYDQSEFMAKAKLAIADSWFREGGTHGLAQAEAEYKDFELFYPTMEEAAEAQEKVCMIEVKQMDKADRDTTHAATAEAECRTLLTQYPNSKFAPQGAQMLRNIQEVLAEGEYRVGTFYYGKGVFYSAANRLQGIANHYPLYSKADENLWKLGDAWGRLERGFATVPRKPTLSWVREYPLSPYTDEAKRKLKEMEQPIPEPDPVAMARQKIRTREPRNRRIHGPFLGRLQPHGPDMSMAAKSGQPAMESLKPETPVTVRLPASAATTRMLRPRRSRGHLRWTRILTPGKIGAPRISLLQTRALRTRPLRLSTPSQHRTRVARIANEPGPSG